MKMSRLLILLPLLFVLTACSQSDKNNDSKNTPSTNLTAITTSTATISTYAITQTSVGSLESLDTPTIAAETPGSVLEILVDIGDEVKKGAPLVKLDDELEQIALGSAKADLEEITALIENQKLTVRRYRDLVKSNSQSRSGLDEVSTKLKSYLANRAKIKHGIEEAQYRLRKTLILAPYDSVVQDRFISVGDYVGAGTKLFSLVNTKKLRARLAFPETIGNNLQQGQSVSLTTPTAPDKTIKANITQIAPMLDASNRAITVIVDFDNPGGFQAGASVDGSITLETRQNALLVPERAVVRRPSGNVVYVINNGTAKAHIVKTGPHYDGQVEILSGITKEDTIAIDGAGFLSDGAKVKVNNKGDKA